mgnify:CR=1 FL=1
MKYISNGLVVEGSTEHILKIQRGGYEFQLTGDRARLWINGRFGVADADGTNPRYVKELLHLKRVGLAEPIGEEPEGVYRAMTQGGQAPGTIESAGKPDSPVVAGSRAAPDHGGAGVPAGTWHRPERRASRRREPPSPDGNHLHPGDYLRQRAGGPDGARILPGRNGACRAGLAEEKEDRPALIHTGRWIVPFQPPVRSFG